MPAVRMRWLLTGLALAAVGAVISVTSLSSASVRSAHRGRARSTVRAAEILTARPLPGDQLLVGPVLLDDRFAVWAEAGRHRLLLRSLDVFGRTRTIFSTTRARGVSRKTPWPFAVSTLAAGGGRVAFVEHVMACVSSPARNPRCPVFPRPASAWNSSTLFAGHPGRIHALQTVGRCKQAREPWKAAVSSAGIVEDEGHDICPGPHTTAELVLRSFSGQLIRVLTPHTGCVDCIATLRAAGPWAAWVRQATNAGHPDQMVLMRVGTLTETRVSGRFIGDVAVDGSGHFALLTPGPRVPCQGRRGPGFGQLAMGRAGGAGIRVVSDRINWNLSADTPGIAIAGRRVAFFQPHGQCQRAMRVMVGSPRGGFTSVPGFGPPRSINGVALAPLVFDGHLLATRHGGTIQLTATGCGAPSVPVPTNEPVYSAGPTQVVAGFYIQGGPAPVPPCRPEPRGPYAATIRLTNPHTGAIVASQTVKDGHLAHITVAPGTYKITSSHGATFSPTVKVRQGYRVRQDVFEDVP